MGPCRLGAPAKPINSPSVAKHDGFREGSPPSTRHQQMGGFTLALSLASATLSSIKARDTEIFSCVSPTTRRASRIALSAERKSASDDEGGGPTLSALPARTEVVASVT